MAHIDRHSQCVVRSALDPVTATTGDQVGDIVDLDGFGGVEIAIQSGTLVDGSHVPSLEHGDAADLSDTADAASYLLGTVAAASFPAPVAAELAPATTHLNTVLVAKSDGYPGNALTLTLVKGSLVNEGELTRVGSAFTFAFKTGVTTVTNFEGAIAALAGDDDLIDVKTGGTGANLLVETVDEFTKAFSGGIDGRNQVRRIGYRGPKRYLRLTVTSADAATGGPLAAVAILLDAHCSPTPASGA